MLTVLRETRNCICGCGETFICKVNSSKKFIGGHQNRGKNNPSYIDGKTKNTCIDCGKIIFGRTRTRCLMCYTTYKVGANNPFFGKCHTKESIELQRKNHAGGVKHHTEESKAKVRGQNHPNWNNGSSYLPYSPEFTEELKESIRKRDNYICQNCDMTNEEHITVFGYELVPHHIDYDKMNCKENNLITLCSGCNSRANFNRKYWKEFYSIKVVTLEEKK